MKRINIILIFLFCGPVMAQNTPPPFSENVISLAGVWKFKLDPFFTGISSNGVQLMPGLSEDITLPGSTDQAGKGYRTDGMTSLRLTRQFEYKGAAWYEKEIFVPDDWKGKEIELFLERAHWETSVWINGKAAGSRKSLSTPHRYFVSSLIEPGKRNVIRIRVDNNIIHNIEYSHAISAETQTNWNGIIGKIELRAYDKVHISDIQVYPDATRKLATVRVEVRNPGEMNVDAELQLRARVRGRATIPPQIYAITGADSLITATFEYPLGDTLYYWDEFDPALYELRVNLTQKENHAPAAVAVTFGIRSLETEGTLFKINGRPLFIRGTVNCAEFPLTGYPPTDLSAWLRIFQVCRDYGLNAMRFHSWCPPKAAFEAADQLGIYLQVENSDWRFTVGKDEATNAFLKDEADRILKTYGNHPSFVMFCEGNEMVGPKVKEFLSELVTRWKASDPRRLYTGSAAYPVIPENQFNVLYGARPQRWKEGLKGRFNVKPLDTRYDYADYVARHPVPMITHEIGQWCVYPNFDEIAKYTGVLKPYNYELFRELMRERNLIDQAHQFTMASGKFQVIQKKEEIESYLRTPGFGGYHLLQLNDFPGQGTSPVGIVDVFWDPKPYVTASEFSRFQAARVPLLRTDKFTWTNDEHFTATAQFANFGASPMQNATVRWNVTYPDGTVFKTGEFGPAEIPMGSPHTIGEIAFDLSDIGKATRLDITMFVDGTRCKNTWSIWVYPRTLPVPASKEVRLATRWDKKAKDYVQKGGTLILLPDTSNLAYNADPVFSGISWNTVWSGMPPNLLGVLCDPSHAALKDFPTEYHSNWQWWDVVRHSRPMVLDHFPVRLKPIVQMIPDWNNPRKLALLFEARVGKGKLLMSSVDFRQLEHRPVARQFLHSIKSYAASESFHPKSEVSVEMIDKLFKP